MGRNPDGADSPCSFAQASAARSRAAFQAVLFILVTGRDSPTFLWARTNTSTGCSPRTLSTRELPAAANGSALLGLMADAWQVPLTDMGDDGKAAKFLVLPPDYSSDVPAAYIPIRSKTYNTFTTIRSILAGNTHTDERNGDAIVQQIKI
jgi:hypothetical protein